MVFFFFFNNFLFVHPCIVFSTRDIILNRIDEISSLIKLIPVTKEINNNNIICDMKEPAEQK